MMVSILEKVSLLDEKPPEYGSSATSVPPDRQCISFHNVSYTVRDGLFTRKTKTILHDVSGIMYPGFHAIMGPTGSGKTTLLDILADRKSRSRLSGTVLVNGQHQPKNFKCMNGYVVQDDVVMGTLTVKENLYFSASLRLPLSMSWNEKKKRVERTIAELGLGGCADTKIGNEFFRGVSGGERKRTNIGMELIIEPQVLFLDEPTTGLDAFTAVSVIQLLKNLSKNESRIIITSIHQPRYSIYKQFDSVTLLSQGCMVYHGPMENVLDYFTNLGFVCEMHDNPADFLLDVINQCEGQLSATSDLLAIEQDTNRSDKTIDLATAYTDSMSYNTTIAQCNELMNTLQNNAVKSVKAGKYATNALWQLFIVMIRSIVNLARNPMTSIMQFFIVAIFAAIVGGIYFQIDTGANGFQNRLGAIFFIAMTQIFGNLSAIDIFIQQKSLFIHENASGYYRVSSYFIAKVLCDIIPMRILPLCIFSAITYFMIGFQIDVEKFFTFFLTLCLVGIAACSSAFWISAGVKVAGLANLFIALTYVVQMLFGGFLLTLDSLPDWIRWMQYTSLFRYSVEALIVNEVDGLNFTETIGCGPFEMNTTVSGRTYLDKLGYNVDWLWYDEIGLAGLSLIYLTLTYITLRLIKKDK